MAFTKTLTFKDGTVKDVLADSVIYPSGNPNIRSKLEIHMAVKSMTIGQFVTLFSNEDNLMNLTLTAKNDDQVIVEDNLTFYIVTADCGRRLVENVDPMTGTVSREYHYVAVLEQLTETEQKLWEIEHSNEEAEA